MSAPDYISPVLAYRLWQSDVAGLKSLNSVPWVAAEPLAARCGVLRRGKFVGLRAHPAHIVPRADCRCGVYGSKRLDSLRSMCFWDCGVRGEVLLWGTVVEHEHGWRAQFAYPKTLHLPSNTLPVRLAEIESRLQSLVPYRCDIFVAHHGGRIPLWRRECGFDAAGLDFLTSRGKEWYVRQTPEESEAERPHSCWSPYRSCRACRHASSLRLVEQRNAAVPHKDIAWDEVNSRWELNGSA